MVINGVYYNAEYIFMIILPLQATINVQKYIIQLTTRPRY